MKKTVGILGGMGPLATADLFKKIIENTPASKDQEHLHIVIDNNPVIPDRTAALLYGGESPIPYFEKSVDVLEKGGADFVIMPCNTAHGFYRDLCAMTELPVLNMIEITHQALLAKDIKKVGLLATSGTIKAQIYQSYLGTDIDVMVPTDEEEEKVMDLIFKGVKAGNPSYDPAGFVSVAERMLGDGAECIILGCTELPVAMEMYSLNFPAVDPTLELAKGAVAYAMKEE